jgi:uncharacterized membrane protein
MKKVIFVLLVLCLIGVACGNEASKRKTVGFVTAEGTVGSQTITIGVNEKTQIVSAATITLTTDPGATVSFTVVIATNAVQAIPVTFSAVVTPPTLGKATDIQLLTTSATAQPMAQTTVTIQMSVSATAAAAQYSIVLTVSK